MCGLAVTVFWHILEYPFVQDDWDILYQLRTRGEGAVIADAISPNDNLLFRPLGILYIVGLYQLFGLNPFGYYAVALLLHVVNSVLVADVLIATTHRPRLGWAAAMLYATSVVVHLTPLTWVVGIYELSATLLVLLSIRLYVAGKSSASAIAAALALCAKESSVFLVPLLVTWELVTNRGTSFQRAVRRLWPHSLVFLAYTAVKLVGVSPFSLPPSHPYYASLRLPVVIDGIVAYARWFADALVPADIGFPSRVVLGACWVAAIVWAFVRAFRESRSHDDRLLLFFGAWAVLALAPVLALPNHRYHYYLTLSLPPLLLLTVAGVDGLAATFGVGQRVVGFIFAAWIIAATWLNTSMLLKLEGGQGLTPMAQPVRQVSEFLLRTVPRPARGAVLVFEGVRLASFGYSAGPRIWYGDDSIEVFDMASLRCRQGTVTAESQEGGQERVLDPDSTYVFKLVDRQLRRGSLTDERLRVCRAR